MLGKAGDLGVFMFEGKRRRTSISRRQRSIPFCLLRVPSRLLDSGMEPSHSRGLGGSLSRSPAHCMPFFPGSAEPAWLGSSCSRQGDTSRSHHTLKTDRAGLQSNIDSHVEADQCHSTLQWKSHSSSVKKSPIFPAACRKR